MSTELVGVGDQVQETCFMPEVPVDDRVVALVRLPVGVTALYEISKALDKHLGPDLVIRTDTGIVGWCVISKPESGDPS